MASSSAADPPEEQQVAQAFLEQQFAAFMEATGHAYAAPTLAASFTLVHTKTTTGEQAEGLMG
jgi:hypothetical protein